MVWLENAKAFTWHFLQVRNESPTIGTLLDRVVGWIGLIAGVLAFVYLIYSGILYVTAGGNPDQAKKAQQGIINAIIGIIIIILAYAIVRAVVSQFGGAGGGLVNI